MESPVLIKLSSILRLYGECCIDQTEVYTETLWRVAVLIKLRSILRLYGECCIDQTEVYTETLWRVLY